MWPHLLGRSWVADVLLSAGLLAAIIAAIAVLLSRTEETAGRADATRDRLQTAWHRYEEGDLTPWEFERLVNPRPAAHSQHAVPAGDVGAAHAAAD